MIGFDYAALSEELKKYLGWALDIVELAHYKCDITSDTECRAEEYGDGAASQHELLRKGSELCRS